MAPLRIGVLGCADIAVRRMLPAFAASALTELSVVASRSSARAAAVAGEYGARAVGDYREVLAAADVDAVYVPLPAALHADWVEAALLAGKHVLSEKPLTTDAGRTARLLALARARGLALVENVMFVHHSQHAAVRDLVAEGAIGEPRALTAAFTIPRLPPGDIRFRPELGGGALLDTGVYPVRAAMHLLGTDLRVVGATLTSAPGFEVDTAGAALLSTPEGVTAQVTFGLDHGYRSAYQLWGADGRLTVEPAFTPAADHRPVIRLTRRSGTEEIELAADDQVAAAVAAFARAAATARTDDAALHQARLLDDIRDQAGKAAVGDLPRTATGAESGW
ncbi:Gfo/Idh/MocA family oxidoreductase [Actinosynnema sp. NPDC049800]